MKNLIQTLNTKILYFNRFVYPIWTVLLHIVATIGLSVVIVNYVNTHTDIDYQIRRGIVASYFLVNFLVFCIALIADKFFDKK
jgi:hypothetical protein